MDGETSQHLSQLAQLTIVMDEMAAMVHCLTFPGKSTANQEVLPAEVWMMFVSGEKVKTRMKDTIERWCHSDSMKDYTASKHGLLEYDMDHITRQGLY